MNMINGKEKQIYLFTLETGGLDSAIMGMRSPLSSYEKSDSYGKHNGIGDKDIILAQKLSKAGTEHSKYLRQIQVWVEVVMPRYWWQEADTYKFGTKNSESTMHTLHKRPFTRDDFYIGKRPSVFLINSIDANIYGLNILRDRYLTTKNYEWIVEMKRLLPESFIQRRFWNTNYAELMNIYHQRKNHRLKEEWGEFCEWCESLDYFKELCIDPFN